MFDYPIVARVRVKKSIFHLTVSIDLCNYKYILMTLYFYDPVLYTCIDFNAGVKRHIEKTSRFHVNTMETSQIQEIGTIAACPPKSYSKYDIITVQQILNCVTSPPLM